MNKERLQEAILAVDNINTDIQEYAMAGCILHYSGGSISIRWTGKGPGESLWHTSYTVPESNPDISVETLVRTAINEWVDKPSYLRPL